MDIEKFTERSQGFIQSAEGVAERNDNQFLTPEHLLKVLLDDNEGLCAGLIKEAGGDLKKIKKETADAISKLPKVSGSGVTCYPNQQFGKIMSQAEDIAQKAGDEYEGLGRCNCRTLFRQRSRQARHGGPAGIFFNGNL